jgi:hypothetical protein
MIIFLTLETLSEHQLGTNHFKCHFQLCYDRTCVGKIAGSLFFCHRARIRLDPAVQADLLQLEQIAAGYSSRERFLTELALDPPTSGPL